MLRLTSCLTVLVVLVAVRSVMPTKAASGASPQPPEINVLVLNHSFEDPPVVDHIVAEDYTLDIPSWGHLYGKEGIYNPSDPQYPGATDQEPDPDTPIPDGKNVAFIEDTLGRGIFQNLAEPLMADMTYTLSAYFGNRVDRGGYTAYTMNLMAGDWTIATTTESLADGWIQDSVTASVANDHPGVGRPLRIEFWRAAGSAQLNVDSVSLTYIPEPSTLALLCMAAVGLLVYALRKTR